MPRLREASAVLLLADWYTGARLRALLAVTPADVDFANGGLYLRADSQKNKADQFLDFGPDAAKALKAIWRPQSRLVWPWPYQPDRCSRDFKRLCVSAGVPVSSGTGSGLHRILAQHGQLFQAERNRTQPNQVRQNKTRIAQWKHYLGR